MGFMDELKKLAKPYTEDEDDFDEFDDDVRPTRASRSSSAPAPSRAPSFDLDDDADDTSSASSGASTRRTPGSNKVREPSTPRRRCQVVLVKPDRFDNVSDIAEHLRSKHAVVLNLEATTRLARVWSISCPAAPMHLTARSRRSPSAPTLSRRTTSISSATSVDELENTASISNLHREAASMFTPQEIQEQTFSKAVFGGYDMQQVDDFLEPLTEDYITLYKENSVLKAKMKILVEKLEEYRAQETKQSTATADAEARSAQMLKETQARCTEVPGRSSWN